jgi:hypothetical protein
MLQQAMEGLTIRNMHAHAGPTAKVLLEATACSKAWQQQQTLQCEMLQPSQCPCAPAEAAAAPVISVLPTVDAVMDAISRSRVWQQHQVLQHHTLHMQPVTTSE